MSIYTRVLYIIMSVFFIVGLTSCGGDKPKSEKAKLTLIPSKPIVITADVTEDDKVIAAPWFKFLATLSNPTDEMITIVALQVDITGLNSSGTPQTTTVAFSPGSFNDTVLVGTTVIECKYNHFAQIAAGDSAQLRLLGADSACGTPLANFAVGGNPKGPPGNTSFRYTLKVKPLGWFGGLITPTNRFDKVSTFYTQ